MKIALLGDIALIGRYDRTKDTKISKRISCIKEFVKDCDFVIANQESVLTDRTTTFSCKGVYLRSAMENVQTLNEMGVTHVTLANNHIFDYGKHGAEDTKKALKEAGITYVGLCDSPQVLRKDDDAIMLDGFCCLSANALNYGETKGSVHLLTPENIEKFLADAKEQHCFPIASVHYGLEGLHYPAREHIELFRSLAEHYDYVLHGNHPHAMQGYEKRNNSLIIYAQGNLCFDRGETTSIHRFYEETEETRKGYIVLLEITHNQIVQYEVIPVTDLSDGILKRNPAAKNELNVYCQALQRPVSEIEKCRTTELNDQSKKAEKRDLRFYLNRMNYKYIGAYINGRRHLKSYKEIMLKH